MGNFEYGFDRTEYLLKIVKWFSMKDDRIIIERIYNQLLGELESQKTPRNQMDITERKRILMECYRSFKSDEFRAGLKGKSSKKIAQDFGEDILGILKRKYDMSDKFSHGLISSKKLPDGTNKKMVGVKPLAEDDERTIPYSDGESGFIIQQIGELIYSDGINLIDDIKQYRVTVPTGYHRTVDRIVFTKKIDFDLLGQDDNYEESSQMAPGEVQDDDSGFYTYQISPTYALTVDPIAVTAAKIIEKREKAKENQGR